MRTYLVHIIVHIRDIRRIRHILPLSAATALANSLVSSKLDYCNSLYNGISQANLNKIQRIQNTLARVVTNTSKFEHITPILKKLHWLPIKQRIDYKLCLLTYKTLQIQQPTYLYNSLSFPSHSLSTRSSDSSVLSIPYVRTSLGKRAFSVIAPRLWNSLPPDTRNSKCLLGPLSGVLRAAARLILLLPRSGSVTDRIRTELHWLDIPSRVAFKLCVLAYRCIHGSAPSYLARFFTPVSAIAGRSQLRSASTGVLFVPRSHTLTIGPRAFAISAPSAWNRLPADLRDPSHSLLTFRKKLKTFLFNAPV